MRIMITIGCVMLVLLVQIAAAQVPPTAEVEIAVAKDGNGVWTGWAPQNIVWDATSIDQLPPHKDEDDDSLQDWYFPYGGKYYKATFTRTDPGTYAIRWRTGDTGIWSEAAECTIVPAGTPVHQ